MIHYKLTEDTRSLEGRNYTAYGIAAFSENGEIIAKIDDLTSERDKAELFAKSCERLALSPIHLRDAAEDFIISNLY